MLGWNEAERGETEPRKVEYGQAELSEAELGEALRGEAERGEAVLGEAKPGCNGARSGSTGSLSAWPSRVTVRDQALLSLQSNAARERSEKQREALPRGTGTRTGTGTGAGIRSKIVEQGAWREARGGHTAENDEEQEAAGNTAREGDKAPNLTNV